MKNLKTYVAILLLLFFVKAGYSQSVDEIIDLHTKAMGGADKLMSVKTARYEGTFSGMGQDLPVSMTIKRDNKARMEFTYQGMSMIRATDRKTGWAVNPFQRNKEAEKMPAEELKDMKKNAEIEGELINYSKKGYKVELIGKDDYEGSEVYKIKLTDQDGDVTYYFLDTSTYLILKQTTKRKAGEKEINQEVIYGNYQKTNDIMIPMSMEIKDMGNNQTQKITINKIELNPVVDDNIFKMPDSKQ